VYLSRLVLDLRSRDVRRDLSDIQHLHRTVMSGFPDTPDTSARHQHAVLFRVDDERSPSPVLLVQSATEPDWGALPAGYLKEPDNPATKPFATLDRVEKGQLLRFRLVANPTRKIDTRTKEDGVRRHGRRVDLRGESDQLAWLQRRADAAGFELLSPEQTLIIRSRGRITGRRDARPLVVVAVQYDGLLRITDPLRLREAVKTGIGPAKAYGMGLLSLAPPS
jgi:CRISPR system Cascade subunit CasE